MPSKKRELHRGTTIVKCQWFFSPAIHESFPNKENNATSKYCVVLRLFARLDAPTIRSQKVLRYFLRYMWRINASDGLDKAARSLQHVNARIHTFSWFLWVLSWSSSHPEFPSRPKCSPPKLAPLGRTRPSDSTDWSPPSSRVNLVFSYLRSRLPQFSAPSTTPRCSTSCPWKRRTDLHARVSLRRIREGRLFIANMLDTDSPTASSRSGKMREIERSYAASSVIKYWQTWVYKKKIVHKRKINLFYIREKKIFVGR